LVQQHPSNTHDHALSNNLATLLSSPLIPKESPIPRSRLSLLVALLLSAAPAWPAEPLEGLVLPYRQVEVSAPVASFLVDLKVQEGELVKAGQPLAQLYGKLDELELKRTKAILERREFEAKGVKSLYDSRILPEAKALEARIELDLARLNYETAAEQVRLRSILAPIDGVVVERYREVGEAVQAAQRMFRIVDLSRLAIHCRLRPEQAVLASAGQKWPVRFPQLPQEPVLQAEVVFVDPCADNSGLTRLKLLLENPGGRIHGGFKALVDGPWNEVGTLQPRAPKAP
jgi:RND family efflux transporter MFP subunit